MSEETKTLKTEQETKDEENLTEAVPAAWEIPAAGTAEKGKPEEPIEAGTETCPEESGEDPAGEEVPAEPGEEDAVKESPEEEKEESTEKTEGASDPEAPVRKTEEVRKKTADPTAEEANKNAIYAKAREKMKEDRLESYREAVSLFSNIPGWKDSDLQATRCFQKISIIKSNRKEKIKEIIKDSVIIVITACIMGLIFKSIIPGIQYNSAVIMMDEGNYEGAEGIFRTLGDYNDSPEKLEICEAVIREENYQEACELAEAGKLNEARKLFEELGGYKDSAVQSAEIMDYLYSCAVVMRSDGQLQEALEAFNELDGYLDSEIQVEELREEIYEKTGEEPVIRADEEPPVQEEPEPKEQTEEEERQKKLQLILIVLAALVLVLCIAGIPVYIYLLRPYLAYRKACKLMAAGCYEEAIKIFRELEDYRDSKKKVKECETAILDRRYEAACQRMEAGQYEEAIQAFTALNGYRESLEKIQQCKTYILEEAYQDALRLKEEKKFARAVEAFLALKGYRDANFQASLCRIAIEKEPVYLEACELMEQDRRKEALALFNELKGYRDVSERIKKIKTLYYNDALNLMKEKHYPEAISAFAALEGFKDSSNKIMECRQLILDGKYQEAKFLMEQEEYESAIDILRVLRNYEDSPALMNRCRKAIRAPRPFNRLSAGMTTEDTEKIFGKRLQDQVNPRTGYRELVFGGVRLMDAVGYLTAEYEKDLLVRAVWSADFCWEPFEKENDGLYPGIEYTKYRDYYTFLFGNCTSEYLKDNHKGSWWREPELTVDVSGYDYVTIHFAF